MRACSQHSAGRTGAARASAPLMGRTALVLLVAVTLLVASLASFGVHPVQAETPTPGEDFDTLNDAGNRDPVGIWSNGTTMWVADVAPAKIYAYRMSDKTRDSGKDFNSLFAAGNQEPTGIWSNGTTMWVADIRDGKIYAYRMSDKTRDPGKDFNTLIAAGNRRSHRHLVERDHHVGRRQWKQKDLRLQDVGQDPRPGQGLQHPQ